MCPGPESSVAAEERGRDVMDRVAWASSSVTRDAQGRASACPSEEGRFDGGEGRGRNVRPVRSAALPRQAPAVSDGAGATAGGEEVRSPEEPDGAGDRIESRRARRPAQNDEWASSGKDCEPRLPNRTRHVQP